MTKFANVQHVTRMLQAFSSPRTVSDACIQSGVSMEIGLSAVRLLLFRKDIIETADRLGRPAFVKVRQ
jgi:hypothetical protein